MKIRIGFVSNSSSQSFCIYGVYLNEEDIKHTFGLEDCENTDDICDKINAIHFDNDVVFYGPDETWSGYYLGVELFNCKDNEVFGNFKKHIRDKINVNAKNKLNDDTFGIHQESWYNG